MDKRKIIFGTYDTALDGLWTLAGWTLTDPQHQSHLVNVPGRDGPLDLSTVLTDGEPRYGGRTLTVWLESSEGTRLEREDRISEMINQLDGWRLGIVLPDKPQHYLTGRLHVEVEYNDNAHAAVVVTATCDPWLYFQDERAYLLQATADQSLAVLSNAGRRTVVPVITVESGQVNLVYGAQSWALSAGVYQLPDLALQPGNAELYYSGEGRLQISYREAVLR
jgi:hypothetical protein